MNTSDVFTDRRNRKTDDTHSATESVTPINGANIQMLRERRDANDRWSTRPWYLKVSYVEYLTPETTGNEPTDNEPVKPIDINS